MADDVGASGVERPVEQAALVDHESSDELKGLGALVQRARDDYETRRRRRCRRMVDGRCVRLHDDAGARLLANAIDVGAARADYAARDAVWCEDVPRRAAVVILCVCENCNVAIIVCTNCTVCKIWALFYHTVGRYCEWGSLQYIQSFPRKC